MEKQTLNNSFLSGNPPAGAEYKSALEDLLRAFPYFQLAQVMYAKKMYDDNEPEAANRIKLASVYAPDRKAMYLLFKKPAISKDLTGFKNLSGLADAADKPEMKKEELPKYNFVYSSPNTIKPPEIREQKPEIPSLSETFIQKETEAKTVITPQVKTPEKIAPVIIEKKEELEPEKVQILEIPIVTLIKPTIEKPKEAVPEKKPEPLKADGRKPYTAPTIVKKRSFYTPKPEIKKTETILTPLEKPALITVVEEKPIETPKVEREPLKIEDKKSEPVHLETTVPIEVPVTETQEPVEPQIIEEVIPNETLTENAATQSPFRGLGQPEEQSVPQIIQPIVPIEVPAQDEIATLKPVQTIDTGGQVQDDEQESSVLGLGQATEPLKDINLKFDFSSWLKVIPELRVEKKQETVPLSSKETKKMIDKFLEDAPRISRPKAEFFSPVKAAKKSITEDDTIVSETLAKIYFTQGNLPKALKAYQILLERNPEKNTIFAPRIEEIKALIKENTNSKTK